MAKAKVVWNPGSVPALLGDGAPYLPGMRVQLIDGGRTGSIAWCLGQPVEPHWIAVVSWDDMSAGRPSSKQHLHLLASC